MAVATMAPLPPSAGPGHACCPNCGYGIPSSTSAADDAQAALLDAQTRIADLEAQVQLLNQKASAAVDRWADYEDELSRLRSPTSTATTAPSTVASPTSSFLPVGAANRISALLSRKSTPNLRTVPPAPRGYQPSPTAQHHAHSHSVPQTSSPAPPGAFPTASSPSPGPPPSPTPSAANTTAEDLMEALTREQKLRHAAESRLSKTSTEVEELSVALFEQANEMVATERRARARLEERVEVLERRDVDKKRRLDRIEQAMGRIERAKALLAGGDEGAKVMRTASAGTKVGVDGKRSW